MNSSTYATCDNEAGSNHGHNQKHNKTNHLEAPSIALMSVTAAMFSNVSRDESMRGHGAKASRIFAMAVLSRIV